MNPARKVVAVQLWRTFDEIVIPDGGTSVALGVFDGLHRGHRASWTARSERVANSVPARCW